VAFLPALASGTLVVSSVLWTVILSAGRDPFGTASGFMAGVGLLLLALVAVAGLLLASGRWSRLTGVAVGVSQVVIAASVANSALTVVAALASLTAVASLVSMGTTARRPRPPAADRPSPPAAALLVGLIAAPALMGIASPTVQRPAHWVAAGAGLGAGAMLARASSVALWAIRVGLPLVAIAATIASGWGGGMSVAVWGFVLTALAWRRELKVAVTPLTPLRAPGYRIPPQLTPTEILEAGGIDADGRPK